MRYTLPVIAVTAAALATAAAIGALHARPPRPSPAFQESTAVVDPAQGCLAAVPFDSASVC